MTAEPNDSGRRSSQATARSRTRVRGDVILALLLPLACAASLVVLQPDRDEPTDHRPVASPLTSASVLCPSTIEGNGGDLVGVTTLAEGPSRTATGRVDVGLGPDTTRARLRGGRVTVVRTGTGPVVVTGADDLAPGLVAGRATTTPLAAADCAPTRADLWFTGAGSGATHDSVVELVNPNSGPALADIAVRSAGGLLDVPQLRGVSVPGESITRLDLGEVVPRRGELALEVHTRRGRLAVHVVDAYDELGSATPSRDWLAGQPAPSSENVLLGLDTGTGERTLVLANPGGDEVRATLRVITPTSVFAPAGVAPIRVAPDSTEAVSLDDVLQQAAEQGATGLLVESTGPVTATLRQVVDGDLSLLAPADAVGEATGAVVPVGAKRLLLAGADAVGAATVEAFSGDGTQVLSQRVELTPDTGTDLVLPDEAVLVTLVPERTSVRASVIVREAGTAVVSLRELVRTGLVPDVRPGLE